MASFAVARILTAPMTDDERERKSWLLGGFRRHACTRSTSVLQMNRLRQLIWKTKERRHCRTTRESSRREEGSNTTNDGKPFSIYEWLVADIRSSLPPTSLTSQCSTQTSSPLSNRPNTCTQQHHPGSRSPRTSTSTAPSAISHTSSCL